MSGKDAIAKGGKTMKKRPRPPVQVVACQVSFPISTKSRRPSRPYLGKKGKQDEQLLDWTTTVKEVQSLGSKGFTGKQKRSYEDDEYRVLTGREKKKHQVPLPIVRGIKKKAAQREARLAQERRDAGIVVPSAGDKKKKPKDSTNRIHGPAPSIGFMSKGIFQFKRN